MAWEEWETLKSEAALSPSTQMRLNHIPADPAGSSAGSPSGGQPDLASSHSEKQAAVRAIEDHIEPDTRKAGSWVGTETNAVVRAFGAKDGQGWATSAAVAQAYEKWGEQVHNLMNRLSADKAALRGANSALHGTDIVTGAGMNSVSVADSY